MDRGQGRELHNAVNTAGRSQDAREAFPEVAWEDLKVSQEEGPVDMTIGRDNPEWMPVPMQEEPYERFTLMWTNLSPRYILRENGRTRWRL